MYHVPLDVQCIYGWSNEDGDGKKGCELPGGWERMEIALPLICRELGSLWIVGGGPEGDGKVC